MIYTLIADHNNFVNPAIDSDYVESVVGSLRGERRNDRIDMNHQPRRWEGVFPSPIKVNFPRVGKQDNQKSIPDITEFQGRLFLSIKAYDALKQLIGNDGEFITASHENGKGYIFTPLQIAKVDPALTHKNEWDEILNIGFYEDEVKNYSLFRTSYNNYMRLYCQQAVVDIIQKESLTGFYITNDLANIFPEDRSDVVRLNG